MWSDHLTLAPKPGTVIGAAPRSAQPRAAEQDLTHDTASDSPPQLTSTKEHSSPSRTHIWPDQIAFAPKPVPVDSATHTSPLAGSPELDLTNDTASASPSPLTSAK